MPAVQPFGERPDRLPSTVAVDAVGPGCPARDLNRPDGGLETPVSRSWLGAQLGESCC